MIIKYINIKNIGPFLEPFTLVLDSRVTILTGPNDVGKSSLLKALELALTHQAISQEEVNHDYLQKSAGNWSKDANILITANLEITQLGDLPPNTRFSPSDYVNITRKVAADLNTFEYHTHLQKNSHHNPSPILPVIVRPKLEGALSDELNLKDLKPLEQALLNAAFESDFSFSKYEKLSDLHYTRVLMKAQATLNKVLGRVLPSSGMIRFDLHQIAGDRTRIALMVRDRHDGITPFGLRGEGVRRLITLLAHLITTSTSANHRLIILDEPENSLHADAQHLLREFLWAMTENGQIQVVYATHSPSMINPLRPEQVRALIRESSGETATTKLIPRPTSENFIGVRTALGISASDSLLYAPVTIITEGETEVRNILPLIHKLSKAGKQGFSNSEKLLGLCTFLDGMGDSFALISRVARAHGTKVILFLDGDKRAQVRDQNIASTHPEIPIVYTPGTSEFEELIPKEIYIRAAVELVGILFTENMPSDFETWVNENPRRARPAFSKRVELWFRETFDPPFQSKARIMNKAIELATVDQIEQKPLIELLDGIQKVLSGSSFD